MSASIVQGINLLFAPQTDMTLGERLSLWNTTQQVQQLHAQSDKKRRSASPLRRSARLSNPVSVNESLHNPHPPPPLLQSKPEKRKREAKQLSRERSRISEPMPSFHLEEGSTPQQDADPIRCWIQTDRWPQDYLCGMDHILARNQSTGPLRRKRSDTGSDAPSAMTPSDQKLQKSDAYQHACYETLLATKDSFMSRYGLGITNESKRMCQQLLDAPQPIPENTVFADHHFEETCEAIRGKNEARVVRDISLLIVPSAEASAIRKNLPCRLLIESVNEVWDNSIPLTNPRPQPDYSVGFRREAFAETQHQKLRPFIGELTDTSVFMATYYLYFPFLSSEVKCCATSLEVADRQNMHSMTLAVRGVVELFRVVKREKELHREILAFSISYDNEEVRIFGHFPVIEGKRITYHRHPIHKFNFTALDGKYRWTTYNFTENLYSIWMPAHFKRLCSAIDAIPLDVSFALGDESEPPHHLESHKPLKVTTFPSQWW